MSRERLLGWYDKVVEAFFSPCVTIEVSFRPCEPDPSERPRARVVRARDGHGRFAPKPASVEVEAD